MIKKLFWKKFKISKSKKFAIAITIKNFNKKEGNYNTFPNKMEVKSFFEKGKKLI